MTARRLPVRGADQRGASRYFYLAMAVMTAVIVIIGFGRTLDRGLLHPAFAVPRILWAHVIVAVGWILLFIGQTMLIVTRRTDLHRRLGQLGALLALLLVVTGVWVAITMARLEEARGDPDAGPFLIVPLTDMLTFTLLAGFGLRYRHRPDSHRRLMLLATLSLTGAAFSRFPTSLVAPGGGSYLAIDLMVLAGLARDVTVDRRVHAVYRIALPLLMASQLLTLWLRQSGAWPILARALMNL